MPGVLLMAAARGGVADAAASDCRIDLVGPALRAPVMHRSMLPLMTRWPLPTQTAKVAGELVQFRRRQRAGCPCGTVPADEPHCARGGLPPRRSASGPAG